MICFLSMACGGRVVVWSSGGPMIALTLDQEGVGSYLFRRLFNEHVSLEPVRWVVPFHQHHLFSLWPLR